MKITMHGVFLLLFSILQSTWLEYIGIFGVKPNLFLVYIILICCYCERIEGATIGFVFGFVLDMLIGRFWGLNAIIGMILCYSVSLFCEKLLSNNNVLISMVFVFVASLIHEGIYYFISFLGMDNLNFGVALLWRIFPESVYNAIVAFMLYFLLNRLAKFFYTDKGETIG